MAERSDWIRQPFSIDAKALRRLSALLDECLAEADKVIREAVKGELEKRSAQTDTETIS
jgi:hypothetical protein